MSPQSTKLRYRPRPVKDPKTGKISEEFYPAANVRLTLTSSHRIGKPIEALIDSGPTINLFPASYATVYFGMNERSLKKGHKKPIFGIGGKEIKSFGHQVTLQILGTDHRFKAYVFFSPEHNGMALLGRRGFFDRFKRISFDEQAKEAELEPLP